MTLTRTPPPKARAAHAGPRRPGRQIKKRLHSRETVHSRLLQPSGVSNGHSRALDPLGLGEHRFRWRRLDPYPPSPITGHLERVAEACAPVLSSAVRAWEKTSCGQSTMFWSWVPVSRG